MTTDPAAVVEDPAAQPGMRVGEGSHHFADGGPGDLYLFLAAGKIA